MSTFPTFIQHCIKTIRQSEEIKDIQTGKDEVKLLSLDVVDESMLHRETPKDYTKTT